MNKAYHLPDLYHDTISSYFNEISLHIIAPLNKQDMTFDDMDTNAIKDVLLCGTPHHKNLPK